MASMTTSVKNQEEGGDEKGSSGSRKAYFMFVRFQPPHSFHIELIRSTCEKALREGADVYVFVSPNEKKPNKNPILYPKKIELLERIYTHLHGEVPFHTSLRTTGYKAINSLNIGMGPNYGKAHTSAIAEVKILCAEDLETTIDFIPRGLYVAATSLLEEYDNIEYFCGGDSGRARIKGDFEKWQGGTSWLEGKVYERKTLEVMPQGGCDEKTGRVGTVSGTTCRELARKIYLILTKDSGLTDENKETIRRELVCNAVEKEILIEMIEAIGSRMTENYEELGDLVENLNELRIYIFQLEGTESGKKQKHGGMRKKKTKSLFRKKRTKKRRINKMNSPNYCCAGPGCPEWKHCINVLGDGGKWKPKSKKTLKIMEKCGKRFKSLGKKYKKCMKKERKKLRRKTRKTRRKTRKTRRKSRRKTRRK